VKFLCDRCKTRYSIGDDRVRGKILKIRCKNCANVITVREGMDVGDDPARAGRPTTGAPPTMSEARLGNGALNAAFSAQLAKPPPALEEEWYVSIDGDQSGPFSLGEAQRWVASKPLDAELHCWSEGFDDWLAVDKVSHFRGLRKKPAPPAVPPPMPRPSPRAVAAPAPRPDVQNRSERFNKIDESEPKPLFAATMASLEKSASTTLPPVSATAAPAVPVAKTNGMPKPSVVAKAPAIPIPTTPAGRASPVAIPAPTTGRGTGSVSAAAPSVGAQAVADAFDIHGDGCTTVEAAPFIGELAASAEPGPAVKRPSEPLAPAAVPPKPMLSLEALKAEHRGGPLIDDDNLDIGEVSRVVNLKDIARVPGIAKKPVERAPGPVSRISGPINRGTGTVAKLAPSELGLSADVSAAPVSELAAGESVVVPTQVAQTHRRGLAVLIGVAVLLLGVVGAVVFVMMSSNDDGPMGLGRTTQYNTDRPEDYAHPKSGADTGSGSATKQQVQRPRWSTYNPGNHVQDPPEQPTDPTQKKLQADEIEDMGAKQSDGIKRCYMRAQKGALGIEMQDLKKIWVTLTVDKTGSVTDVDLSDHKSDTFGACLIARIKGWKFRASPGGQFKIPLVFSNG
jgi:predicted Zn finger-like uncharacterized protein